MHGISGGFLGWGSIHWDWLVCFREKENYEDAIDTHYILFRHPRADRKCLSGRWRIMNAFPLSMPKEFGIAFRGTRIMNNKRARSERKICEETGMAATMRNAPSRQARCHS